MVQKQNKADIFETAFRSAARADYPKALKLFQHGAIEGKYLVLESCDFLRGVGMVEALEGKTMTTEQTIARVARSISRYGLYSKESKEAAEYCQQNGIPVESVPFGSFQGDMNHQYGYSFLLSTPGRWCAAAAFNRMREGTPEEFLSAHEILDQGYRADKAEQGEHQILDIVSILLYLHAGLFNRVIDVAAPYANPKGSDWNAFVNAPDTETNTTFYSDIARAALATAYTHLGEFDSALSLAQTEFTSAAAQAQSFFVQANIARIQNKEEEEVNRLMAHAETSNPYREDIKEAHHNKDSILRQTSLDLISKRTNVWDVRTEPSLAAKQAMESAQGRQDIVDAALAELDSYIGMDELKLEVRALADQIAFNKTLEERGLEGSTSNLSLTFQGPPGVGKTSVARILHRILYGYGILKEDSFVEVDRSNLIGQYQGETVKKTKEQLVKAQNGTFFLDEAYSLVQGENDMYGNEALDAIVKFMEDHKGEMCVILAGYRGDMQQLLRRNEGLNSRFKRHLQFPSYKTSEIAQIAAVVAKSRGKILPPEAVEKIDEVLTRRVINSEGNVVIDPSGVNLIDKMGNGRGARNIVEEAEVFSMRRLQNKGLSNVSNEELQTFTVEDVEQAANVVIDRTIES